MTRHEIRVVAVLAAVAVLLAAANIIVGAESKRQEPPEYLISVPVKEIVRIDVANMNGYIHLVSENGKWNLADDETFNVSQSSVALMLDALAGTRITGRIGVGRQSELDGYSLLSPQCIIEFADASGRTGSIRIGTMSAMTGQLYVLAGEDSGTVLITTDQIAQAFGCAKLDLLSYPEIPTPSEGHSAVTVTNRYGTVTLEKEGGGWYAVADGRKSKTDDRTAFNYYYLTWDMHWRGRVAHDAQDLSKYGLGGPRISYSLEYTEGGEKRLFELELGSSLPDGTCYAKIKGENDIFLLDSLMADWLESTKPEDFYGIQE